MTPTEKLRASAMLEINRLASEARMDKALGMPNGLTAIEEETYAMANGTIREERLRRALHKLNVASY